MPPPTGGYGITEGFSIVERADVSTAAFVTRETTVRKLAEAFECLEPRVNRVLAEPGEVTTPHPSRGSGGGVRCDDRGAGLDRG